jgi:hypothetical protein
LTHAEATEKTYLAIGRFMFEFSQMEYAVRALLGEEIGLKEQYFSAVMESYDVAQLIRIAKDVFEKSRGDDATMICNLLNRFFDMISERNRVAHGLWVPFMDGGTMHYTSRDKLTPKVFKERAEHLEKLSDVLCQLRADFETEWYNVGNIRDRSSRGLNA